MSKPIVSLQPTKAVVAQCAATIYAAYVGSGHANADPDQWLRRSVCEAIDIARMVDDAVHSDAELPVESPKVLHPRDEPANLSVE